MKHINLSFIFFLILFSNITYSQKINIDYSVLSCSLNLQKRIFNLNEPIVINFKILNLDYNPIKIKLSEYFYYNFRFVIRSLDNNSRIDEKDYFYAEKMDRKENLYKEIDVKTVNLNRNEFYGQSVNLINHFKLNKPGNYIIQGFFRPIPSNIDSNTKEIKTQIINIEIQDSINNYNALSPELEITNDYNKVLNPYDTVAYFLNAYKQKNWVSYFNYLSLDSLIKQYPKFDKRYDEVPLDSKQSVMNEFKQYLKNYFYELGIKSIKNFSIYRSVIENDKKQASIFVKLQFVSRDFAFYRKYTFKLYQYESKWFIYRWFVENI